MVCERLCVCVCVCVCVRACACMHSCVCMCVHSLQSYILVGGSPVTLIPPVSVPMNSTECACQTFEDLAANTQSPVEHGCQVVENCRGQECELDVFGAIYYIDFFVDPCGGDVLIEYVIKNAEKEAIFESAYNETTSSTIEIQGVLIPIVQILVRHDYSIELEVC